MSKDRFKLLEAGASRPSRVPLPPGMLIKARAEDTEGRFTLIENRASGGIPPQVHETVDEFVYVIDGELGIEFDGAVHRLTAGMSALLPRGVTHAMRTLSDTPAHALRLSAPGGWERYLEDVTERALAFLAEGGARCHLEGESVADGDRGRFIRLDRGAARPGRIPMPPAFAVKARTKDTHGRFSLLEVVVAQEIPRHVHHRADEAIYVLAGELGVDFDDRTYAVTEGQFVLLPHGVPHAIRPAATPPPRVIQISSPGGWERFIEDLIEARTEVSVRGRLHPAKLNRIAAKYHITYEER